MEFMQESVRKTRKPQARTEATKAKILDAALEVFVQQGFENANLDLVAKQAGCSRGAIYAHYTSKEEVFLGLVEHRVQTKFAVMRAKLDKETELEKRRSLFQYWAVSQIDDPSWGILNLEYKLYAVRHPEAREKLLHLYESLFADSAKDFLELLFGQGLSKAQKTSGERRLAALGGVLSGLVLESQFRPELLPPTRLRTIAEEVFANLLVPLH